MIQIGTIIERRYEVLEKIGTGGMSDVFKAKDHKLGRYVAIKFLKPEFCEDKSFISKFQVEAQSAAALLHPNVVSVYDVNGTDGNYYIVMEYVDGITLKKYIDINGKLPVKEATSIAIQVAQGMEAAHNVGIIHRDIKPQNVLISREGKIKVTDFGIARTTTANTMSPEILGSAQYISPEQARGASVDMRSDIYSFGIVFYEMITGQLPFDGDSAVTIALKHIQERVPLVSEVAEGIPSSVEKIIEKCTQKKPDRRYQKTASLLADLKMSLVTPDDDFVVLEPEDDDSATIIISGKDAQRLRSEGRSGGTAARTGAGTSRTSAGTAKTAAGASRGGSGALRSASGTSRSNANRPSAGTQVRNSVQSKKPAPRKEYPEDEEIDEFDDDKDISGKRFDKLLTVCGIIAGVIILIALVIVLLNTFGGGCKGSGNKGKETSAVESTETTTTTAVVPVPDVVGWTVTDAQNKLEALKLKVELKYEASDKIARDNIIRQSVAEGVELKEGETVTLTVSSGIDTVKIGDYAGKEQAEAEEALKKLGLKTTVSTAYSDEYDTGVVIETKPKANSAVAKGSTVTLVVSMGEETTMVAVPQLIGFEEDEALALCAEKNLYAEVYYQENNASIGQVIDQSIAAGTSVEEGTYITLVVGIEEENNIEVPVLIGSTEDNARALCEQLGLVAVVDYIEDDDNAGLVIEQSLEAGSEVPEGTGMYLVVGKESETTADPEPEEPTFDEPSPTEPETTTTDPELDDDSE